MPCGRPSRTLGSASPGWHRARPSLAARRVADAARHSRRRRRMHRRRAAGKAGQVDPGSRRRRRGPVLLTSQYKVLSNKKHGLAIAPQPAILMRDLRLALRALRGSPTFTIVAMLSVAAGIGANVTVFSLVDAL